jgi:hypothetical protein
LERKIEGEGSWGGRRTDKHLTGSIKKEEEKKNKEQMTKERKMQQKRKTQK